jgi:hypothetical protein
MAIERVIPGNGSPVEDGHVLGIEQTIERAVPLFLQDTFERVNLLKNVGLPYTGIEPQDGVVLRVDETYAETVTGGYAGQWINVSLLTPSQVSGNADGLSVDAVSQEPTVESLSVLYDPQTGEPNLMEFRVENGPITLDPEDERRYVSGVTRVVVDAKGNDVSVSRGDSLARFAGGELRGVYADNPDAITKGFEAIDVFLDRAEGLLQE